jgi:nitrate/nitrite transport system substrate-binding protein
MAEDLALGYMPLTDSLPLLAAQELGLFAEQGLRVTLHQEVSWSNIRDKLLIGQFDAAQMLAPMVLATSLGLGGLQKPLIAPYSLNLGGNGITLSRKLHSALQAESAEAGSPAALRTLIERRHARGERPLVLAAVFPWSSHNIELRYWLASAGIAPDGDVKIVILPPSQMVDHLRLGHIDGFCAGAPWSEVALASGVGCRVASSFDIWNNGPNKVLGLTEDWAHEHPDTVDALLRALYKAGSWLDASRNEAADLLARYLPVDTGQLRPALTGEIRYCEDATPVFIRDMFSFHKHLANFPWISHGYWYLRQMERWNWLPQSPELILIARRCYRPDLYRRALGDTPLPLYDWKSEGVHGEDWMLETSQGPISMGPDRFIDGQEWDWQALYDNSH